MAGQVLEWDRVSVEGNHVVVTPVETVWTSGLRIRWLPITEASRSGGYGPRPAGTTSIEAKTSLVQQAEEINRLASQVDRSHAWADIASCWGIKGLQLPIKKAVGQIGWDRINWLVHANPGWPSDLVSMVEHEISSRPSTGGKLPFYADDYLLQDF